MSSPDEARPRSIFGYAERNKIEDIRKVLAQHLKDNRAELRKNLESVLDACPTKTWWFDDTNKLNDTTKRLPNGRIPLDLWIENAIHLINNDPRLTDSDRKTKVDVLEDVRNAVLRKYPPMSMPPVADDSPVPLVQNQASAEPAAFREAARSPHRGSATMSINATAASAAWIELIFDCVGNDIRIGARGSRGENVPPRPLGIHRDAVEQFAARIARAAAYGQSLPNDVIAQAQALQKSVLADEIGTLFVALSRAVAPNPIVLRFMVQRDLQNVPWEALCNPGESLGFWGTSPKILPVRGVATTDPWTPRKVRGAVKVLAIAPTASTGLANLKLALEERIASGEIEWLEPVEGIAARVPAIFDRLRREPLPHVVHFLGHGGINKAGQPCLRMGDEDDEEKWLPTELLAQQLGANFCNTLRLIVLEACEGAKASQSALLSDAFVSSAQILARDGADAVVAYQWPVKADIARTCSTQFYRALTSPTQGIGDAALALNQARLAVLATCDNSAAALDPVLYLRGPGGQIFDFAKRDTTTKDPANPQFNPTMGQPLEGKKPVPGNAAIAIRVNTTLPLDLIDVLAELYPDVREARALWVRAGGRGSEIENIPRPRDLWQHIWTQSVNGARVKPISLLKVAQADFPGNQMLARYISLME